MSLRDMALKTCISHFCGDEGDRTPDLIHAMDALSQLSYVPVKGA